MTAAQKKAKEAEAQKEEKGDGKVTLLTNYKEYKFGDRAKLTKDELEDVEGQYEK